MADQNSRWTDNPFRTGRETPEYVEWLQKRNEATRIFQETGDNTALRKVLMDGFQGSRFVDESPEQEQAQMDKRIAKANSRLAKARQLVR